MNAEKLQLTGGQGKEKRRDLDFYPTPPEVTIALMEFLKSNVSDFRKSMTIWEPACGDGAMTEVIRRYGHVVVPTDIIEGNKYGFGGIDFLDPKVKYSVDAIITNPPFSLSQQFIEKAVGLAPVSAMLLKSQYWHARKRYDLFMNNPPAYVLPLTWRPDFMQGKRGGAPTMEVLWTVWIEGNNQTKYLPLLKP